jgi:protein TonB
VAGDRRRPDVEAAMHALQLVDASYHPAPRPRRRLSREAAMAVGLSLAVHVGVSGYIATQKFAEMTRPYEEGPVFVVDTYQPPKESKPRPAEPPPKAVQFRPTPVPLDPPQVPPIETVVTPSTVDEIPPQTIATTQPPPQPPVQLAELRPPQPPAAKVIRNPSWLRRPSGAEMGRLYPRGAAEAGLSGAATLMCEVVADGSVRGCALIDESPKGRGFGAAALAGAKLFKLNPRTVDGEAVEGAKVRIPLVFSLAD